MAYPDPGLFQDLIDGAGVRFRWSRAVACPCLLNDDTGQNDPTCVLCYGDGWWYTNPDQRDFRESGRTYLEVNAGFSQAGLNPDLYQTFGQWHFGDAQLVVHSTCRVGYRDKFVGLDHEMAWTEVLRRVEGFDTVVVGKSRRPTADQRGAMRYAPVRVDLVGDAVGTRWYEGHDFVLVEETKTEPRRLQWLTGKGPVVGTAYTICYACRPVWVVEEATYTVQFAQAPERGIQGKIAARAMPTAFKTRLDYLTDAEGS